jgi:hypothetical protein
MGYYLKPQNAFLASRIVSNDRVASSADNKALRFTGPRDLAYNFAVRITKLNRRTAKRQQNQLA